MSILTGMPLSTLMMMVVGADELFDVLDGLLEHRGLDGHEDQVDRLALLRRDIIEAELFAMQTTGWAE